MEKKSAHSGSMRIQVWRVSRETKVSTAIYVFVSLWVGSYKRAIPPFKYLGWQVTRGKQEPPDKESQKEHRQGIPDWDRLGMIREPSSYPVITHGCKLPELLSEPPKWLGAVKVPPKVVGVSTIREVSVALLWFLPLENHAKERSFATLCVWLLLLRDR